MKYLPWAILLIAIVVGYGFHQKQVGILQGEIHARGESIKQLSHLAATQTVTYQKAKATYVARPTLESCSVVLLSCEQMNETKSKQIEELNKQVDALTKRGKPSVFGKLPWVLGGVVLGKLILK